MKQTSVEWFEQQLDNLDIEIPYIIFSEAKEMHKEETCQFVSDYLDDAADDMTAEEYYDQIYKNDIP